MKHLSRIGAVCVCVSLFFNILISYPSPAGATVHQFYDASVEISDSLPAAPCNWTIDLKNVQDIPPGGYVVITPQTGEFTIPVGMTFADLDLSIAGVEQTLAAAPGIGAGSAWGITVATGQTGTLTLTNNDTDTVAADSQIIVEIGTHATSGTTGTHQVDNPIKINLIGSADVWRVDVASFDSTAVEIDYITLLIATIEHVEMYAGPMPHLTFEISSITAPDGGDISASEINWRGLTALTPKTAVLRVKVNTDAQNGFIVYLKQDGNMLHFEDPTIDIDQIKTGGTVGTNDIPVAWSSPPGTTIGVDTGYLGYTTSDITLNSVGNGVNRFVNTTRYSAFTTSSEEILYHPEATQSNTEGQDYADITFQIEVNNLQPSGNYSNDLIFIAKPVF